MLRRVCLAVLWAILAALVASGTTRAQPLVADLSKHLVAITAGFTGAEVLLFGAIEGKGRIVVVVEGPLQTITVRRKERVAGVWVNRETVTFENAPSFYQVMASEALDGWLPTALREQHQIGIDYLKFRPVGLVRPTTAAEFQQALIRNKQRLGHYGISEGKVTMLGGRLFRAEVFFPANVPTGIYTVEVLLVRDGEVVSAQKTPLYISKSGLEAEVYRLAHAYPALYGAAAIVIAIAAGLLANAVFRKT